MAVVEYKRAVDVYKRQGYLLDGVSLWPYLCKPFGSLPKDLLSLCSKPTLAASYLSDVLFLSLLGIAKINPIESYRLIPLFESCTKIQPSNQRILRDPHLARKKYGQSH